MLQQMVDTPENMMEDFILVNNVSIIEQLISDAVLSKKMTMT